MSVALEFLHHLAQSWNLFLDCVSQPAEEGVSKVYISRLLCWSEPDLFDKFQTTLGCLWVLCLDPSLNPAHMVIANFLPEITLT